jgi:hypothetical protein
VGVGIWFKWKFRQQHNDIGIIANIDIKYSLTKKNI